MEANANNKPWRVRHIGLITLVAGSVLLVTGYALLPQLQAAQVQSGASAASAVSASPGKSTSPGNSANPGGPGKAGDAPPVAVQTVAAQVQDVPVESATNGTVVSLAALDLRPQITGLITAVHVREGQFVPAGTLLFSLDARSDQANLDKAAAQVARDRASLQDLQRQHQRSLQLVGQQFISQGAADTLQTQVAQQQAQLQADLAAQNAAQVALGMNQLRAPQAGRIGAINVYPGSLVGPATVLLNITQMNPIALSFTVPENQLAAVLASERGSAPQTQASQQGGLSVTARLGPRQLQGRLRFIDNSVETATGTIRVKAEFANHDGALWPGQYLPARIRLGTLRQAVVVPQAAIIQGNQGQFVFTVGHDQRAKVRLVQVQYAWGDLAVVSGLQGQEHVIVEGKQNLRPGSRVKPGGGSKPAAAANATPSAAPNAAPTPARAPLASTVSGVSGVSRTSEASAAGTAHAAHPIHPTQPARTMRGAA